MGADLVAINRVSEVFHLAMYFKSLDHDRIDGTGYGKRVMV